MVDTAKLEKIARMALFDVPNEQIARAIGMSDIVDIIETAEYKTILANISTEYFDQNQSLNDGWDSIEALSLATIVDNLTWSKDPDFALRAATMANRAKRRGNISQEPINGQAGARAVINLTATFIEKLQQFGTAPADSGIIKTVENEPAQKDADFMVPEKVEKLFVTQKANIRKVEDIINFFPDVNNAVPAE